LNGTSLRASAMISSGERSVSNVGGAAKVVVVGVEDQNDSSAATPRFTQFLSESTPLELN
jgi:hypothetical protein